MDRKAKELLSIFTFPFGMLLLALFPGMNCFVYSGHGGLGMVHPAILHSVCLGTVLNADAPRTSDQKFSSEVRSSGACGVYRPAVPTIKLGGIFNQRLHAYGVADQQLL